MFTFRLNNTTEQIYNDILTLHNSCFNTKFTIKNIIPYAVQHFILFFLIRQEVYH